jgi:PKD repeat protein
LAPGGTAVSGINITHLTGPAVASTGLIYLKSAAYPNSCPFSTSMTVGSGISTSTWNLGQTWSRSFTSICGTPTTDPLPDNITVYVVSGSQLLYSVVLPGQKIVTPPVITSTWVSSTPVAQGAPFSVYATITGGVKPNSVYANLATVPGLPSNPVKMVLYQGQWTYNATSGAAGPGTFTGFVNASGSAGQTTAAAVTIRVSGPTGQLYVSITAQPTSGVYPLTVTFATTQSGGTGPFTYSWNFGDGGASALQNPSHTYTTAGTFLATLSVTDSKANVASTSVTITVSAPTPSCSGQTIATSFGTVTACSLNQNQQTVFTFSVSNNQWNNYNYVNVFESDGTTSGPQPVYQMGTGRGGTPSLGSARQSANGPNAMISISLSSYSGYGGPGTYWAIVTTGTGDSGGFCFEAVLSNSATGSGPTCSATFAISGPMGTISQAGPAIPARGSTPNKDLPPIAVAARLIVEESAPRAQRVS